MRKPKFPDTLPADALAWTEAEQAPPDIPFTPVPRLRTRRHGWSEDRQRRFIAALARCGTVSAAARSVGMTARGAYRLLDAPGADSFAKAWDIAFDHGFAAMQAAALERALNGAFVPVYRRGKLVRVEHRQSDRLAIALLGGKDRSVDDYRRTAVARRLYRQDMAELDAARAERERRIAEAEEQYAAETERLINQVHARSEPRVRTL